MMRSSMAGLRATSPWLALSLSAIIVLSTVSLTLLWPRDRLALGGTSSQQASLFGTYQGPQQCGECHDTELRAWSGTIHAQASFDPVFQAYLQQVERPGECFTCHATGYDTASGQFVLAGVTCEACHGPYRVQHPGESMMIATSQDLCGTCHRSTLFEWESSRHGQVGVTCIACHEVHNQRTQAAQSTDTLCAGCHLDRTQDATHAVHGQADIRCIACHLARPEDDVDSAVEGHAITAHSFAVTVSTCSECHDEVSLIW